MYALSEMGQSPPAAELDVALEEAAAESSALDRRDDLLGGVEKALSRSLKRLVSDEQNEVLDRLRRLRRGRVELEVGPRVWTGAALAVAG